MQTVIECGQVFKVKLSPSLRAKLLLLSVQSGKGQAQVVRELVGRAEYVGDDFELRPPGAGYE